MGVKKTDREEIQRKSCCECVYTDQYALLYGSSSFYRWWTYKGGILITVVWIHEFGTNLNPLFVTKGLVFLQKDTLGPHHGKDKVLDRLFKGIQSLIYLESCQRILRGIQPTATQGTDISQNGTGLSNHSRTTTALVVHEFQDGELSRREGWFELGKLWKSNDLVGKGKLRCRIES